MDGRLTRREFLHASGAAVGGAGLRDPVRASTTPRPVFVDGFDTDTTDEYTVRREAVTDGEVPNDAGVAHVAENQRLAISAPAGAETVVSPAADLPVPERGHVQIRAGVPRTFGEDFRFGVRLVESTDEWLGFRAFGDDSKIIAARQMADRRPGGFIHEGGKRVGGRHHVFDFYWGPDTVDAFADGEPMTEGNDAPLDPVEVQIRALQCDAEVSYWRLDHETGPPPEDVDERTPAVTRPITDTPTATPTTASTPVRTSTSTLDGPPDASSPVSDARSATPRPAADEWFEGLAGVVVGALALPVVGSLVVGSLAAASTLLPLDEDE